MAIEQEVLKLLGSFLKRNNQAQVTYSTFLGFLERYFQQNENVSDELNPLRTDPHQTLSNILRTLEKTKDVILLRSSETPLTVVFPHFYFEEIEKLYIEASQQMAATLPAENQLSYTIPEYLIQAIDIKTEFVSWLTKSLNPQIASESPEEPTPSSDKPILRLLFPEGLPSLLATRESLKEKLVVASVQKLRHYLINPKNMAYIKQKLAPVFRGREIPLKDVLQQILTSPEQCAKGILNATDFLFQFWTHLSTNIIKEFADKQDKLIDEQNYCQAAYLLGYYSVYCKGIEQRKKDSESGLKAFLLALKKPPYAFSMKEMYTFTDEKGVPLLQKFTREQLHTFIAENMRSKDGTRLPTLFRSILPGDKEVFIVYETLPLIVASQLPKAQKEFRDFYLYSWQSAFIEGRTLSTIESEKKFALHVESRLRERYPLLFSILKFDTLYLVSQEANTKAEIRQALVGLLVLKDQVIKPYTDILNLNHGRLLADTKILLPFWIVIPVLKDVVQFFRKLFLGKDFINASSSGFDHEGQEEGSYQRGTSRTLSTQEESTQKRLGKTKTSDEVDPSLGSKTQSSRAQKAAFKEQVEKIAKQFTLPGKSLDQSMSAVLARWNLIIDPTAKKNLTEDVNSMCRDFLRGLKISYRKAPPTPGTLKEMAGRLAENEAFQRIRDKEALRTYIELYFLKVLSK
ncbi:MAG: hypothetical protein GW949_07935 [Spirochaetales bacterium]|nr:hypothetical protein [Spirochaetales bacterium]